MQDSLRPEKLLTGLENVSTALEISFRQILSEAITTPSLLIWRPTYTKFAPYMSASKKALAVDFGN